MIPSPPAAASFLHLFLLLLVAISTSFFYPSSEASSLPTIHVARRSLHAAEHAVQADDLRRRLAAEANATVDVVVVEGIGKNESSSSDDDGEREAEMGSAKRVHDPYNGDGDEDEVEEEELEEDRVVEGVAVGETYLGERVEGWDEKRKKYYGEGSNSSSSSRRDLFIVTGSQAEACSNPDGDHLMLRCFKNKVDYARVQGAGIFYNTAVLDGEMPGFWTKPAVLRAAMLAHPEAEWFWWLDADAVITDVEFRPPLRQYDAGGINLVVHGWSSALFQRRSWVSFNAGSFLLRNCQWSLDLLERWASISPKSPISQAYTRILSSALSDRPPAFPTDDQSALAILFLRERRRWASKLRLEEDYYLSAYWAHFWLGYEDVERRLYAGAAAKGDAALLEAQYGVGKEDLVEKEVGPARERQLAGKSAAERRPFVTHFTGCQPCSGVHNPMYKAEDCRRGMVRALNYADNQVLRTLGYRHPSLEASDVRPAPLLTNASAVKNNV